jgi:D-alanine-D-alanine ligase
MNLPTVCVLFGGRSSEHEISLRSAVFVLKNIPSNWNILPVAISRSGSWLAIGAAQTITEWQKQVPNFLNLEAADLRSAIETYENKSAQSPLEVEKGILSGLKITETVLLPMQQSAIPIKFQSLRVLNSMCDVVFPVLHGPNGEDGRIQGLCELAQKAYVGCNSVVSALGMDKNFQKIIARQAGVNVVAYQVVSLLEWHNDEKNNYKNIIQKIESEIGYPCFAKPNALGSAVGVRPCANRESLIENLTYALSFDERALVEKPMKGTEVECAFLGDSLNATMSTPGEIAAAEYYSYEEKYNTSSVAKTFIPARLTEEKKFELMNEAKKVARALCLEGLTRIDFWNCAQTGKFVFNEVNTLPGMTSISMYPQLLKHDGIQASQWIEFLLKSALQRNDQFVQRSVQKN